MLRPAAAWQRELKRAQAERISQPAQVEIYLGAPGTGKSHGVKLATRAALPRVVIWDPRHEYELPGARYFESVPTLAASFLSAHPGPWIFRPAFDIDAARRQFDQVCNAVMLLQLDPRRPRLLFAIEECSDVIKTPGNPPAMLRKLAVQSRHYGVRLLIAGQRPTFVDTTMRGSATLIRCGRLGYAGDCKTMGDWLGIDPGELQRLPDRAGFLMERGHVSRF